MNTTEHELVWTSKAAWGAIGKTHSTDVTIGRDSYHFVIDQPRKGYWVVRGWKNFENCLYREGNTLTRMKGLVADIFTVLRTEAARVRAEASGPALTFDEGPADWDTCLDCGEPHPGDACTEPDVPAKSWSEAALAMASLAATLRPAMQAFLYRPPCGCPTPTHRMSCGTGATPKVVRS